MGPGALRQRAPAERQDAAGRPRPPADVPQVGRHARPRRRAPRLSLRLGPHLLRLADGAPDARPPVHGAHHLPVRRRAGEAPPAARGDDVGGLGGVLLRPVPQHRGRRAVRPRLPEGGRGGGGRHAGLLQPHVRRAALRPRPPPAHADPQRLRPRLRPRPPPHPPAPHLRPRPLVGAARRHHPRLRRAPPPPRVPRRPRDRPRADGQAGGVPPRGAPPLQPAHAARRPPLAPRRQLHLAPRRRRRRRRRRGAPRGAAVRPPAGGGIRRREGAAPRGRGSRLPRRALAARRGGVRGEVQGLRRAVVLQPAAGGARRGAHLV
mmetsp:Transcript_9584/g.23793  ORF Transcript_9584/g.23793 Transcript_9584/m.23793 type:complete len:320 (+) Transcript_9584:684-1643(+)